MNLNVNWTLEEDEILIDFVRNHEALYNTRSKDFRQTPLKTIMWQKIGIVLKKPDSDCIKRWTYIRDYYIRRRGQLSIGSDGETGQRRSNLLTFLDSSIPIPWKKNTITNVKKETAENRIEIPENTQAHNDVNCLILDEENDNTEDVSKILENEGKNKDNDNIEDMKIDNVMNKKKKKNMPQYKELLLLHKEKAQEKTFNDDETDLFFKSMAKIVKKLPRGEQAQLRMQISSLVGNAELRNITSELRKNN